MKNNFAGVFKMLLIAAFLVCTISTVSAQTLPPPTGGDDVDDEGAPINNTSILVLAGVAMAFCFTKSGKITNDIKK